MPNSLSYLRPEVKALKAILEKFVLEKCQPAEKVFEEHIAQLHGKARWTVNSIHPIFEQLRLESKELGLWNLFIPPHLVGSLPDGARHLSPSVPGLSYREYGVLCETMGKSFLAPEVCNCHAPDTGNMEVLLHHGSTDQKRRYLVPMLKGEIRSAFLMTEPDVASSDATNMETTLTKIPLDNGRFKYQLNGRKWWSTGAMDPRCKVALVVARMDYSRCAEAARHEAGRHDAHTVVLIDMNHPGVELVRPLYVMGYDDAPHGHAEVALRGLELDESCLIIGEGKGFEVAQKRLGPGRIHHCMRAVGMAQRCFDLMIKRTLERKTFGKELWQHGGCQELIHDCVADLEAARLLTLNCAAAMDEYGTRRARDQIALIKVAVPQLTHAVVDRCVQVFGGAGVNSDLPLARILVGLRSLRIADGPDAVHKRTVALLQVKKMIKRMKQSRL